MALAAAGVLAALLAPAAMARNATTYRVTITNLTSGQPLTPPVVSIHRGRNEIFSVGDNASLGVQEIAENGNNTPLIRALRSNRRGSRVLQAGKGPLVPEGKPGAQMFPDSVTFTVRAPRGARNLSFASMLICTNDGFTGVNSLALPRSVGRSVLATSAGYDARTEQNTEDFADIVPPCQALIGVSSGEPGTASTNPALAEGGVIARHEGIRGGADLVAATHGWTDPVARIRVRAIR